MSMFTCTVLPIARESQTLEARGVNAEGQTRDQGHLVLGANAVAANFTALNVLQLQLGDEILHVGGAFDVVLVAEYLSKSNV
jgi:hypothetical protein